MGRTTERVERIASRGKERVDNAGMLPDAEIDAFRERLYAEWASEDIRTRPWGKPKKWTPKINHQMAEAIEKGVLWPIKRPLGQQTAPSIPDGLPISDTSRSA